MTNYERWLKKLDALRAADPYFRLFGSILHRYRLNRRLTERRLVAFERKHQVSLPEDYRAFLKHCGNGGAGPYYGVFPLGLFDGSGAKLVHWTPGDGYAGVLARPFPHSSAWNLPTARLDGPAEFGGDEAEQAWRDDLERDYWSPALTDGAFPICHQGCAYRNLLVVCGGEYGNVWLDGRPSDAGLAPEPDGGTSRRTFADWYEGWLDAALAGEYR